jgi:hypothetical protein
MEEKNQQDRFLGVDREWGDDPEGRVKVEGASYLFHLPSRITPKGGSKYGLIIMLEPPHLINSLLYGRRQGRNE